MNLPTAPVAATDELIEALSHAYAKVTNPTHRVEIQALHAQLLQRRFWTAAKRQPLPDLARMFDDYARDMREAGAL